MRVVTTVYAEYTDAQGNRVVRQPGEEIDLSCFPEASHEAYFKRGSFVQVPDQASDSSHDVSAEPEKPAKKKE